MVVKEAVQPEAVFTPRANRVRSDMYIERPILEKALLRALRMSKHVVIHGESGAGKSWLYKRLFEAEDITYEVINLGRASSAGTILAVVESTLARNGIATRSGYSEEKKAAVKAFVAEGELSHSNMFAFPKQDAFEACLKAVRAKAGTKRKCCLVFDNLEHILDDPQLIKELVGLLLLVDDSNYAQYDVKILLVGTSNDIRSYITQASNSNTVTNRLMEIPEVARLSDDQARVLATRGFIEILGYTIEPHREFNLKYYVNEIIYYADLIPQYLQDICLQIAFRAQENGNVIDFSAFDKGRHDWVRASLISELSVVEFNMNSRTTKIGRKNQVIYALGACKNYDLTSNEIELIIRREFPNSCKDVVLNVPQLLSELASSQKPLIRRTPRGDAYRFVDPKLRMIIRLKMTKIAGEQLYLRPFDDSMSDMNSRPS
ncbi:ATP-binding protein [Luteibacter yeojuensis]|uniref:ATP-binding protein n=1 Tax=Luteibacter yeojuensis TaxID=345309 RepID=A0A7X5QXN2_9GAMM|nr:ATP-binding protein [Luteibacter yeojuensis]NID17249.1 ATP-binding protein [Luteibacter yeojuensis]